MRFNNNDVVGDCCSVGLCVAREVHNFDDDTVQHVDGRLVRLRVVVFVRERDATF